MLARPLISYHSKVNPIGALRVERIAEAVLLCVFIIAFPAPLLDRMLIIFLIFFYSIYD